MNYLKHLFTVQLIINYLAQTKASYLKTICAVALLKMVAVGFFTHAFSSIQTSGAFNQTSLYISSRDCGECNLSDQAS